MVSCGLCYVVGYCVVLVVSVFLYEHCVVLAVCDCLCEQQDAFVDFVFVVPGVPCEYFHHWRLCGVGS